MYINDITIDLASEQDLNTSSLWNHDCSKVYVGCVESPTNRADIHMIERYDINGKPVDYDYYMEYDTPILAGMWQGKPVHLSSGTYPSLQGAIGAACADFALYR